MITGAGKSQKFVGFFCYVDFSCSTWLHAWFLQLSNEKGFEGKTGGNQQCHFKWRCYFLVAIHPSLPTLGVVSQPLTPPDGPSFRAGPLYTLRMDLSLISNWTIQPMHPQGPEGIDRKRGPKDTVPANGSLTTGARGAMSDKREPRPKH